MGRWYDRVYIEEGDGGGCVGCLAVVALLFGASFVCSFSSLGYHWYENKRIESQRIVLPEEALNSYAGKYNFQGRYQIVVERSGTRLFSRSPDDRCELLPVTEVDVLFHRCANGFGGRGQFAKDARGGVTALIITHRDGHETRAVRK